MRLVSILSPVVVLGVGAMMLAFSQPACETHCALLGTCGLNEKEVDDCDGQKDCHEIDVCGETMKCASDPACQGSLCGDDAVQVKDCAEGTTCTAINKCNSMDFCQAK